MPGKTQAWPSTSRRPVLSKPSTTCTLPVVDGHIGRDCQRAGPVEDSVRIVWPRRGSRSLERSYQGTEEQEKRARSIPKRFNNPADRVRKCGSFRAIQSNAFVHQLPGRFHRGGWRNVATPVAGLRPASQMASAPGLKTVANVAYRVDWMAGVELDLAAGGDAAVDAAGDDYASAPNVVHDVSVECPSRAANEELQHANSLVVNGTDWPSRVSLCEAGSSTQRPNG